MQNVILTVHLILALLLVGIVLLQRSEGRGGLMGGDGAVTGRQSANALTKLTWVFAAAFITTSITLTILAASDAGNRSVVDQFGGTAPAPDVPAAPLPVPEGDLTPLDTDSTTGD